MEGPEGAGKTTQASRLHEALEGIGVEVLSVREPGDTELGEAIRTLLLETGRTGAVITPRADAFLFNAARAQLVAERIRPALAAGTTVLCSRFADSTLAYQGAGMDLPMADLRELQRIATDGLTPDLTILLDVPVETGLARKRGEETRFEAEFDVAFHRRVRAGFLALAAAEPERFAVVDATRDADSVFADLLARVSGRLGIMPGSNGDASSTVQPTEPNAPPVRINQ
jgi:dTMP kinase